MRHTYILIQAVNYIKHIQYAVAITFRQLYINYYKYVHPHTSKHSTSSSDSKNFSSSLAIYDTSITI